MAEKDPNILFRAKLAGDAKLRILLSEKTRPKSIPSRVTSNRRRHLGTSYRRRPQDDLYGKPIKRFVNFYDFLQYFDDGDWIEPISTFTVHPATTGSTPPFHETYAACGGASAAQAYVLGVDTADWKTFFRKLEYEDAERYALDFVTITGAWDEDIFSSSVFPATWYGVGRNGSRVVNRPTSGLIADSRWTTKGFDLPDLQDSWYCYGNGAFAPLSNDLSQVKITTTPLYSGTAVTDFTLARNADVFLMPQMSQIGGQTVSSTLRDPIEVVTYVDFTPFWRGVFLNENYVNEFPLYSADPIQALYSINPGTDGDVYKPVTISAFHDVLTGATQQVWKKAYPSGTWTNVAVSNFPQYLDYPSSTSIVDWRSANHLTAFDSLTAFQYPEGELLGAVMQNGNVYYFWALGSPTLVVPVNRNINSVKVYA